jgi:tetratricopeptide (TPR) repeat protein/transglutaminase-like putative cysteine protease
MSARVRVTEALVAAAIATAAALALAAPSAHAVTAPDGAVGARAQAMGGAFSAIADDGHALYWNPAGLARLGHQEFTSTLGNQYGLGMQDNYLGYVFPITDFQAAAFSWKQAGQEDAGLNFDDNTFSLGFSQRLGKKLSLGGAIRYLQSSTELDGSSFTEWTGTTFDLGAHYVYGDKLAVAATLKDLTGRTVTHKDGPRERLADPQLTLGAAYHLMAPWTVSADVNDQLHLGSEYWYRNQFAVQAGALKDLASTQGAEGEGWTWSMGASARYKVLQFDYAHIMPPFLPSSNRFTAAVAFNLNPSRVRVEKAEVEQVFASQTKRYADHPIGTVRLTSRVEEPQAATLSVFVPGLMDAPTEKEIVVRPKETKEVPISAVFGREILQLDEDRAMQADVRLTYRHKNRTRVEKANTSFFVYRPGAISWEDTRAAAAFVTPSDPVVADFARAVVQGRDQAYEGGPLRNLTTAMRLWNALSGYGITYVPDPNTPFSSVGESKSAVDQIQYPRSLLASRTGDCDDTSVLFCTMLENVGVPTAFLDGPGHILMMFDSGIHPRNALALSVPEELYAVRGERVWIPVETTMLGKSFLEAWAEGAGIYRRWESANDFRVVPVEEAWAEYVPSLPEGATPQVAPPPMDQVDRRMSADLDSLKSWQSSFLRSRYLDPLEGQKQSNADGTRENELALVYALEGNFEDARSQWQSRLANDPADATALNNLANVHLLEGRADSALVLYDRALVLDRDAGILLNQGLARWARGDEQGADQSFEAALKKLPDPADAERLLGLPAEAGKQGNVRRVTAEEIRQRLRQAASRVPKQDATPASGAPADRERPVRVVSKVSGARASDLKNLARVVYWKGHERGKS